MCSINALEISFRATSKRAPAWKLGDTFCTQPGRSWHGDWNGAEDRRLRSAVAPDVTAKEVDATGRRTER